MQSKLWILITDFFFALEEPSNQVTKKLPLFFKKRRREEANLCFRICWAMESFLMDCGGIFLKDLEKMESQTRPSASPILDSITSVAYKQG
jgi:hypothetical protein